MFKLPSEGSHIKESLNNQIKKATSQNQWLNDKRKHNSNKSIKGDNDSFASSASSTAPTLNSHISFSTCPKWLQHTMLKSLESVLSYKYF